MGKPAKDKFVRPSRITVPTAANPFARLVFAEMKRQGVTYDEMEWRSGVLRSTIKAWRTNNCPSLTTLEACLGVLGFEFVAVPRAPMIPPQLVQELEAMAERWGPQIAPLRSMLLASAAGRAITTAERPQTPEHQPAALAAA